MKFQKRKPITVGDNQLILVGTTVPFKWMTSLLNLSHKQFNYSAMIPENLL